MQLLYETIRDDEFIDDIDHNRTTEIIRGTVSDDPSEAAATDKFERTIWVYDSAWTSDVDRGLGSFFELGNTVPKSIFFQGSIYHELIHMAQYDNPDILDSFSPSGLYWLQYGLFYDWDDLKRDCDQQNVDYDYNRNAELMAMFYSSQLYGTNIFIE
jgi:hypothetical protein